MLRRNPQQCFGFVAALLACSSVSQVDAQEWDWKEDRRIAEENGWIWTGADLTMAFEQANSSGKPLMVVLRCPPWASCAEFDEQVVRCHPLINEWMDRFVRVRAHVARDLDLEVFQFDPDLTFAIFFLNADRTIYGRFGSRSDFEDADRNISLEALAKAMQATLDLHAGYPANKAALAGKTGAKPEHKTLVDYPWAKERTQNLGHCAHCHHIGTAQQMSFRLAGAPIPDRSLFPFPMPDVAGFALDPKEKATVAGVVAGSAASKAGLQTGDEILTLAGQPILSIADVQWVLHSAGATAQLRADILRDGGRHTVTLSLAEGWRHNADLSWRPTTGMLRRMAFGGLRLEELPPDDLRRAGLTDHDLALRVERLFSGSSAGRAGLLRGDILVTFDGQSTRASESQLIARSLQQKKRGERIPVTVLRGAKRIDLQLPTE